MGSECKVSKTTEGLQVVSCDNENISENKTEEKGSFVGMLSCALKGSYFFDWNYNWYADKCTVSEKKIPMYWKR